MSEHAKLKRRLTPLARGVLLLVVGLLVVGAIALLRPEPDKKTIVAFFPRTLSIYEGSDVRVIGVTVGTVDEVKPVGTQVQVTMSYNAKVKVPADAKAAIVAPSVVGDRYVQLTPVYTSGPVMPDHQRLDATRTAMPLELDEIYQSLDNLAVGLGPDGANKSGALTRLLNTTAANVDGQGEQLGNTITDLSRFTGTLDQNKDDLFGAAKDINEFVKALAENDETVRSFSNSLAGAANVLADERTDLSAALRNLGVAMGQVSSFVRENKEALSRNISGLVRVTQILVKQRSALDETLKNAPVALANLFHTYNASTGTLDTRANLSENLTAVQTDPASTLCSLVTTADPTGALCNAFQSALPRTAPGASNRAKARGAGDPIEIEHIDRSLAGLLEVSP